MVEFVYQEFRVVWSCRLQSYTVYKNGKFLRSAHKYSEVKSYLS
jgi:hypothetical protein